MYILSSTSKTARVVQERVVGETWAMFLKVQ